MRSALIDILILTGVCSIGYGVWQFSPPGCFIVVGIILVFLGIASLVRMTK